MDTLPYDIWEKHVKPKLGKQELTMLGLTSRQYKNLCERTFIINDIFGFDSLKFIMEWNEKQPKIIKDKEKLIYNKLIESNVNLEELIPLFYKYNIKFNIKKTKLIPPDYNETIINFVKNNSIKKIKKYIQSTGDSQTIEYYASKLDNKNILNWWPYEKTSIVFSEYNLQSLDNFTRLKWLVENGWKNVCPDNYFVFLLKEWNSVDIYKENIKWYYETFYHEFTSNNESIRKIRKCVNEFNEKNNVFYEKRRNEINKLIQKCERNERRLLK